MTTQLPPGTSGLPLVGETLSFIQDAFTFTRSRAAAHGKVVRTKILGEDAVIISGAEGTVAFNDPARVARGHAAPSFVVELFAGESLPFLDGEVHLARKRQVMAAFTREAMTAYVPAFAKKVRRRLYELSEKVPFSGEMEFRRLVLETIGETLLGFSSTGVIVAVIEDFAVMAAGFGALPVKLPGGDYAKALAARDRIVGHLRNTFREHLAHPKDDGLGRMLKARDADPSPASDDELIRELHHFNIAGYITFAHCCEAVVALSEHPEIARQLRAEVRAEWRGDDPTPGALRRSVLLDAFVEEVKRTTRFAPVFFGRAKTAFVLDGVTVPEGWLVLWAHDLAQRDGAVLSDPTKFDPARFLPPRVEQEKNRAAVTPQGFGDPHTGHKCAGYDYATTLLQVIVGTLVRDWDVVLPTQDLRLNTSTIPPHRLEGLKVELRRAQT